MPLPIIITCLYLVFFFEFTPRKSQNECETILTPSEVAEVDEVEEDEVLHPLVVED